MIKNEIYDSSIRNKGDFGAFFEYDFDTGYFYLCKMRKNGNLKIISWIHILSHAPDFNQNDINIRWDTIETRVGLYIKGQLWAVFDVETNTKYGGNYCSGGQPDIPYEIISCFEAN